MPTDIKLKTYTTCQPNLQG